MRVEADCIIRAWVFDCLQVSSTMAACTNEIVCSYKRLSIDLSISDSILARRGGISFGTTSGASSKPRLGVSLFIFDKSVLGPKCMQKINP